MAYESKINDVGFYVTELNEWQAYGVQPGFTNNGSPAPYGPGAFTAKLNALAIDDPTPYGGDYGSSGTFRDLVNLIISSRSATGGIQDYRILDPRTNAWVTGQGRLDPSALLNALAGGKALRDVPVVFTSAFIPAESRGTYYGGNPAPDPTPPPYIPGDPLPPTDPDLTYGYGLGRYGYGLYGQGEGV